MITTVAQPLTPGQHGLTREVDLSLQQLRKAANRVGEGGPYTVSTTGVSTPTTIWESAEVKSNTATDVTAYIRGVNATATVRFITDASITRHGSVTPTVDGTSIVVIRRPGAELFQFVISADNTVQLNIIDGGTAYDWWAWIETRTVDIG